MLKELIEFFKEEMGPKEIIENLVAWGSLIAILFTLSGIAI